MRNGGRAGPAVLRDSSVCIGLVRDSSGTRVVMVDGLTMVSHWNTTGTCTVQAASAGVSDSRIRLRVNAVTAPAAHRTARLPCSTDGTEFAPLGLRSP